MKSESRSKTRKRIALLAIVITLTVCAFLPDFAALGWHLVHGNFATIDELEVPVPQGWRSFSNQNILFIQRMHRFYFREQAFSQITVNALQPNLRNYDYQKQTELLIAFAKKQGYRFNGEQKIRVEGRDVLCISFETTSNSGRLWISCDAPELHLSISFIGDPSHVPALDSIATGIKRVAGSAAEN